MTISAHNASAKQPFAAHPLKKHVAVKIRLCMGCKHCNGFHKFTDVLEAERVGYQKVLIVSKDPIWEGAVVNDWDYEIVGQVKERESA